MPFYSKKIYLPWIKKIINFHVVPINMYDYCAMCTCPFLSSPNLSLPPSVLNCWHLITVYSAKTLNQIINTHIHIYLHIISIYRLFYLFFFLGALLLVCSDILVAAGRKRMVLGWYLTSERFVRGCSGPIDQPLLF